MNADNLTEPGNIILKEYWRMLASGNIASIIDCAIRLARFGAVIRRNSRLVGKVELTSEK